MTTYCASVLISELRKQKGVSQEKLAEGICDRRTISYIENGSISPSKYIYERLMQKLGVDAKRFSSYISSKAEIRLEEIKMQITQLFKTRSYVQVQDLIDELEKDKKLMENRFSKQYILQCKGLLLDADIPWENVDKGGMLKYFCEAIALTVPDFDEKHIKNNLYTIVELELIRMIALFRLFSDEMEHALQMFMDLEDILKTGYVFWQDCAEIYSLTLSSLSKCYRWLERFEDALDASHRGITAGMGAQCFVGLPLLLYQKASALHWLGRDEESIQVFYEAQILAKNFGDEDIRGEIKDRIEEFHNHRLTVQIEKEAVPSPLNLFYSK